MLEKTRGPHALPYRVKTMAEMEDQAGWFLSALFGATLLDSQAASLHAETDTFNLTVFQPMAAQAKEETGKAGCRKGKAEGK